MAKKKNQSLTERIAALINRVGEKPEPTFGDIKSELVECLGLAEALQDGAAIRDAETKVEILEREKSNLKIELEALQSEVEAYRTERRKQEEQDRQKKMPPVQFEILNRLSHESGYGDRLNDIAAAAKISVDEAEIHMDRLRKAGFAKRGDNTGGGGDWLWRRTMAGNEYVVAKRLAGEAEIPERYRRKYTDLPQKQHEAVLAMARQDGSADVGQIAAEIGSSIFQTEYVLEALKNAGMATSGDEPQATYGAPEQWWLLEGGKDYLAERELL